MIKKILFLIFLLFTTPVWAVNYCNDANMVGGWLFDEGSGTTVADCSGEGNTGNFLGSGEPAWNATDVNFATSGSAPNSVDFDGVNDRILVTANASINNLANFTYTTWINTDTLGENNLGRVFVKENRLAYVADGGGGKWELQASIGTDGTDRSSISSTTLFFDTWYHIAIVYSAGTAPKLYVNGGEMSYTSQSNGTGTDDTDNASDLEIGNSGDIRTFNGLFTDIGFFSRALSGAEITEIYNYGLEGSGTSSRRVIVVQ